MPTPPNDRTPGPWEIDHRGIGDAPPPHTISETRVFEPGDGRLPLTLVEQCARSGTATLGGGFLLRLIWRRRLADTAYAILCTTGWLIGNVLGVLGCAVMVFIILGHGQWDAFFLHVDNLASRYIGADVARRVSFARQLLALYTILLTAVIVLRGPRFIRRLHRDITQGRPQ